MKDEFVIETAFVEKEATAELTKGYKKAELLLQEEDKVERLLQRIEKKVKTIPALGEQLAAVPVLISLVRSYIKKEYNDLPVGTIIAIVSALLYFVSPVDIIPDVIPGVGHVDDALVIGACLNLVNGDVQEYLAWRDANGKTLSI